MKTNFSRNYFSGLLKKVFILGLLSLPGVTSAQTIITDQADYAPNSVATITGYGFQPGENVTLQVTYADGSPLSVPYSAAWTVASDNVGSFVTTWNVCFCPYSYLKAVAAGDLGSYDEIYFTDAGIDFHQASNQAHPSTPISWINGILNTNNSDYFEGIGVPQRIILYGFPATNGNTHTLTMSHQATKSGAHAYDFLMSWTQAKNTAGVIGNGSNNELLNLFSQQCDGAISATASGICSDLSTIFPPDVRIANPSAPDVMGDPPGYPGSDVNGRISCFESNPSYGNRTIEIRGNAAITSASVTFVGYSQNGNDNYADYTISWTSTSTEIMILFAGRSAQGDAPCGYGAGAGSGSISGGPYHFKLDQLDGFSLGSQDNQIQASATAAPIENCTVAVTLNDTICAGEEVTLTALPVGGEEPYTYLWSTGATTESINASPLVNTTYTVTITDAQLSECSSSATVIVNAAPSCNISSSAASICEGQSDATLTASGGGTYLWSTGATTVAITVSPNSNTTYTVTVTNAAGCSSSCSSSVEVNQIPSCNISPANPAICSNDDVTLTASGGASYFWSTGATSAAITVSPNSNTTYTVTVTSADGCTSSCSRTVNVTVAPSCSIAGPSFLCLGGPGISLTALGGNNCSWVGPDLFTSNDCTIGPFDQESQSGTYTVTISNNQCSSTCSQSIIIIECSDNHCSFTQGAYGSAGGRDCNQLTTTEILNNLLVSPMVIGCDNNTLTFNSADVECLIDRMPGGGPSAQIFGQNTCSSIVGINLQPNGRFRNVLLAQTITLTLNTRYDLSLSQLQLTGTYMETVAADDCPPAGNPIPNTSQVFTIPMSVLNYLGSNNTVQDLLNLANDALCGAYTPSTGTPTLSDISKAADALNRGFDECRFLVGFTNTLRAGEINSGNEMFTVSAYPNPFGSVTTIQFTAEESAGATTVDVFNYAGEHVATLFNGNVEEGVTYKVKFDGSLYAAGVYTYRLSNNANTFYDKLILIK